MFCDTSFLVENPMDMVKLILLLLFLQASFIRFTIFKVACIEVEGKINLIQQEEFFQGQDFYNFIYISLLSTSTNEHYFVLLY